MPKKKGLWHTNNYRQTHPSHDEENVGFMDAYIKGLSGKQAAWAGKKYHGHHLLSETLIKDLENAKI